MAEIWHSRLPKALLCLVGTALVTSCTAATTPSSVTSSPQTNTMNNRAVQLILSSASSGSQAATPEPTPTDPDDQLLLTGFGKQVQLRPPGSAGSQTWIFAPLAEGSSQYRIQNVAKPLGCLTMGEEHAVRVEACRRGDSTQWWRVTEVGGALQIDLLALYGKDEVIAAYSSIGPDDHLFLTPREVR